MTERPFGCRSLATSTIEGILASRSSTFGVHCCSVARSWFSRVNWYWVALTAVSIERSCTGCMKSEMPATPAVSSLQAPYDLARGRLALGMGLQIDQKAARVQSDVRAVDADEGREAFDVRIGEDRLASAC